MPAVRNGEFGCLFQSHALKNTPRQPAGARCQVFKVAGVAAQQPLKGWHRWCLILVIAICGLIVCQRGWRRPPTGFNVSSNSRSGRIQAKTLDGSVAGRRLTVAGSHNKLVRTPATVMKGVGTEDVQAMLHQLLPREQLDALFFAVSLRKSAEHYRSYYSLTSAGFNLFHAACQRAVGPCFLNHSGSYAKRTGCRLTGSDLDLTVFRSREPNVPFTQTEKERIRMEFINPDVPGKIRIDKKHVQVPPPTIRVLDFGDIALKLEICEDNEHCAKIDLVLGSFDHEDFVKLLGSANRANNTIVLERFFRTCQPARIAVSALKMVLQDLRPQGIVLEGLVMRLVRDLGQDSVCSVGDEKDGQTPLQRHRESIFAAILFLQALQEIANFNESKILEIRKTDFKSPARYGDTMKRLEGARTCIQSKAWLANWQALDVPLRHPDRYCFQGRSNDSLLRCLYCGDHNEGVGLLDGSRCENCTGIQICHPYYSELREAWDLFRQKHPNAGPERGVQWQGVWLKRKGKRPFDRRARGKDCLCRRDKYHKGMRRVVKLVNHNDCKNALWKLLRAVSNGTLSRDSVKFNATSSDDGQFVGSVWLPNLTDVRSSGICRFDGRSATSRTSAKDLAAGSALRYFLPHLIPSSSLALLNYSAPCIRV